MELISQFFRKSYNLSLLYRSMSKTSSDKSKQTTLSGFIKVSDTKRRKMEAGAAAEKGSGLQFEETKGDLFSCPETSSLTHCISADVHMGKGIAVIFKKKFQGVKELQDQEQKPGGCAILWREKRYIYYLVTKEKYWHKPTYDSLRSSLEVMKSHCEKNGVEHLCMPRIGCGLDGLQWPKVVEMLKSVFKDLDMKITAYTL